MSNLLKPLFGSKPKSSPIRDSLVLDLPFLGVGDYNDYSSNEPKNIALTNNGAAWTSNQYGRTLEFNGTSDYLSIPDNDRFSFVGDLPFTFIVRFKLDNVASRMPLISKYFNTAPMDGEYLFAFRETENVFGCQILGTTASDWLIGKSNTVGDISGQWHTIVVTYNGNKLLSGFKFIYDGQDISSGTGTTMGTYTGMINRGAPLDIGSQIRGNASFDEYFDGQISYVQIYNSDLSTAEIKSLYEDPWAEYRRSNLIKWAGTRRGGVNLLDGLFDRKRLIA